MLEWFMETSLVEKNTRQQKHLMEENLVVFHGSLVLLKEGEGCMIQKPVNLIAADFLLHLTHSVAL